SSGSNRRMITRVGDDFRFIATSPAALTTTNLVVYQYPLFWVLLSLPVFLLIAASIWRHRQQFFQDNPALARSRQAPKLARSLLSEARQAQSEHKPQLMYPHLTNAIHNYIYNRWNIASTGMTSQELQDTLLQHGVSESVVHDTVRMLEQFDAVRFSGTSYSQNQMQEDYNNTEQLLYQLMNMKNK